MGEAKRRGTFEERKAAAIARNKKFMRDLEAAQPQRNRKLTRRQTQLIGIVAGMAGLAGLYRAAGIPPTEEDPNVETVK